MRYLLLRILLAVPTFLGILLICFLLTRICPGGPIQDLMSIHQFGGDADFSKMGSTELEGALSRDQVLFLNEQFGFDQPLSRQFLDWVGKALVFDLGQSYFHDRTVYELIRERLPISMGLGILGFLISYGISIPLGIFKAVRAGEKFDTYSGFFVLVLYSVPGFAIGVFTLVVLGGGSFWSVFPMSGVVSDSFSQMSVLGKVGDYLWHMTLPVFAYSVNGLAWLTLVTRNLYVDQFSQQYVATARAKGLPEHMVLAKHISRNALLVIIAGLPAALAFIFFAGSLMIETVFSLDGIGLLNYQSIMRRDYPVVLGTVFLFSVLYLVTRIVSDVLLSWVDPRIHFDENAP